MAGELRSIADRVKRAFLALFPPAPEELRPALQNAQYLAIDRQVPLLHSIAILNVLIVVAVSIADGLPKAFYAWMPLLIIYSLYRMARWHRVSSSGPDSAQRARLLASAARTTNVLLALFACWGTLTLHFGLYSHPLVVPMSMMFGGICVAHSLVSLRGASIGGLALTVFPMALAMLLTRDFHMQALGLILIVVGVLQLRINMDQFTHMITALKLEHENRALAHTDALTGLANRRAIMAALDEAEDDLRTTGRVFGVALIDLDGFKVINDAHGHHAGDMILQTVAARLMDNQRPGELPGRLGGDEFIILFRDLSGADDAALRAARYLVGLRGPTHLDGQMLPVRASLGHASAPLHGETARELLIVADRALYAAKRDMSGSGKAGERAAA
ncbi:MAG TPA: diguanylate cyclase [Chakrabartia sp.]|jgi:diguanylate cyclase (GGDEF)-like protein|nr:diguanylate cyclase [Chakrabartia sp.]